MRLYICLIFLTFVLPGHSALSAPEFEYKPGPIEISPKMPAEEVASFRKSYREWSLRLGSLSGAFNETSSNEQLYFYGLRYSFQRQTLDAWDLEVVTGGNNFLHITAGKKYYFPSVDIMMPYYKLSIGDLIDSSENLGSIFNVKKIQAMASIGLDDIFVLDKRLQGELGVAYALVGPQFEVSIGLAF